MSASNKESNKVMEILEKMRVVKKIEDDDQDSLYSTAGNSGSADWGASSPAYDARQDIDGYEAAAPAETVAAKRYPESEPRTSYSSTGTYTNDSALASSPLFSSDSGDYPSADYTSSPAGSMDTDRYLDVDQLYALFNMKSSGVDTIYLIESYISTLPDTLPPELRRSIILKIISASGFDFDTLLNDGINRVSRLSEYASSYAGRTEEIVERHNAEIDALEDQIRQIRELVNERKNLHKRQFLTIESEAQRLKDVLDFITK